MISKERVKYMTKLAAFEEREGKRCHKMTQYFRNDYVGVEMIKSFLMGTLAFGILFFMWLLCKMDTLMDDINSIDWAAFGTDLLIKYLVFIVVYLIVTYIVYNVRYTRGRRKIKVFYNDLKKVSRLYETEGRPGNLEDFEEM